MDLEEGRRVLGGLGSPADLHRRAGGSETEAKMGPDAGAPGSRAVAPRGGAAPPPPFTLHLPVTGPILQMRI